MLLSELKKGQEAVIESFTDQVASLKLMEMGCIPGESVTFVRSAPLGDPIAVRVAGYLLSLRKSEASLIKIKLK